MSNPGPSQHGALSRRSPSRFAEPHLLHLASGRIRAKNLGPGRSNTMYQEALVNECQRKTIGESMKLPAAGAKY